MNPNEYDSDKTLNDCGEEDYNIITQDKKIYIDYFTCIKISPLAREQYTMLGNMHM